MTTVTKITYAANNGSMGEMTDAECDAYRAWAEQEIRVEYPDADVTVDASDCAKTVVLAGEHKDEEECLDFLSRLWDRQ